MLKSKAVRCAEKTVRRGGRDGRADTRVGPCDKNGGGFEVENGFNLNTEEGIVGLWMVLCGSLTETSNFFISKIKSGGTMTKEG